MDIFLNIRLILCVLHEKIKESPVLADCSSVLSSAGILIDILTNVDSVCDRVCLNMDVTKKDNILVYINI